MRRALEPDHDLLGEDEPPRDLVLGAPALMGIFLTVVLVCAVCFGFGYSSGHGFHVGQSAAVIAPSASPVPPTPSPDTQAADSSESPDASPPPLPASDASQGSTPPHAFATKPSPGIESAPAAMPDQSPAQPSTTAQAQSLPPQVTAKPAPVQPSALSAPSATPSETPALSTPAQNLALMVQIAAVTQAADAEILARALRHDGYDAMVRTTTGDPYFHVQVGPFSSYDSARAMKSRLAASGYSAFIRH